MAERSPEQQIREALEAAVETIVRLVAERDEARRGLEHEREVSRTLAHELDPLAKRAGLGTRPSLAQQIDHLEVLRRRAEAAEKREAALREALLTVRAECDLPDYIAEIVGDALAAAGRTPGGLEEAGRAE